MGFSMAVNLKKAGFDVIGYDAFKGVYARDEAAGIRMEGTLKEVAEQADEAIISMVRDLLWRAAGKQPGCKTGQ